MNINSEGRKTLSLYNSHEDRSSTQYARYLISVHIGRFLEPSEHVDHIDNDKKNDDMSNLQVLTLAENNIKNTQETRCKINMSRLQETIHKNKNTAKRKTS